MSNEGVAEFDAESFSCFSCMFLINASSMVASNDLAAIFCSLLMVSGNLMNHLANGDRSRPFTIIGCCTWAEEGEEGDEGEEEADGVDTV